MTGKMQDSEDKSLRTPSIDQLRQHGRDGTYRQGIAAYHHASALGDRKHSRAKSPLSENLIARGTILLVIVSMSQT